MLKRGDSDNSDMHLYSWESWDRQHPLKGGLSPRLNRNRATRASVPSEDGLGVFTNNIRGGAIPPSSSVSSINSLNAQCVLGPPLTPPLQNRGKGTHVTACILLLFYQYNYIFVIDMFYVVLLIKYYRKQISNYSTT